MPFRVEPGHEPLFDERDEMRRAALMALTPASGVPPCAARPLNTIFEPFEPLVPQGHAILRRLADDRAVGAQAVGDQRLGAETLHLFVDDRGQRHLARADSRPFVERRERARHGGERPLHVGGASALERVADDSAAQSDAGLVTIQGNGVGVAAKHEVRPGPARIDGSQQVRPTLAHLDQLGFHAVLLQEFGDPSGNRGFLSRIPGWLGSSTRSDANVTPDRASTPDSNRGSGSWNAMTASCVDSNPGSGTNGPIIPCNRSGKNGVAAEGSPLQLRYCTRNTTTAAGVVSGRPAGLHSQSPDDTSRGEMGRSRVALAATLTILTTV